MISDVDVSEYRSPDHDIIDAIWRRWSPRVMSGEAVSGDELNRLFEAARWAPSCYNRQPWRFTFAMRESSNWAGYFDLLVEPNQRWCRDAGALIVVFSKTHDDKGEPTDTHSFDVGSAWQNLAIQGCEMGLVIHAMQGFDYGAAATLTGMPEHHQVEAMIAVGRPGGLDAVDEKRRSREVPSGRRAVADFAFEGGFQAD